MEGQSPEYEEQEQQPTIETDKQMNEEEGSPEQYNDQYQEEI